ncbi:hypothetical protein IFT67_10300 [Sphingomonas sp. CFBP 13728]|uniref:hypothetical protein n=1 Tax=Sphingomonas sp. CFBP 13728 TaxID=2775294 RepID=UPI001784E8A6|nr:hypothetical protein [Sphingomonas sp. CFBP 13728]MBD8619310.1 hypothetical protein [Sphingomonas sp. CFBP 13728]
MHTALQSPTAGITSGVEQIRSFGDGPQPASIIIVAPNQTFTHHPPLARSEG